MYTPRSLLTLSLLLAGASAAHGQQAPAAVAASPPRFSAALALQVAEPQRDLARNIDTGVGLEAGLITRLDRAGALALRFDAGFVTYDQETREVPLTSTIGGRILVDLTTRNNILTLGVGPQLMAPRGSVRPYVNANVGAAYYFTQSSVKGSHSGESFASTTNFDDWAFAYGAGAGVYVPVMRRVPVALDVGVRYHRNGTVQYLRAGSITDLAGGQIRIDPLESEGDLLSFRLGVTVGLGRPAAPRS